MADTWLLMMFSWGSKRGKYLLGTQNVSKRNQKHFCVLDTHLVPTTNVAYGETFVSQQCVCNIVSSFATTLRMLSGPAPTVRVREVSFLQGALAWPGSSPGRGTVLCSWARHFTLIVPLSTQVYKWVPANLLLGVTLRWTSIPSRGE